MVDVDVILTTRDESPLPDPLVDAIEAQAGARLSIHRVIGAPRPTDPNAWETIARARNVGKTLGQSPWLMFLDDDVLLEPHCILRLANALATRPGQAALAANYLGELPSAHVAMGATLFRREALDRIHFRWQPDQCECQCCCDDLRALGLPIAYLPSALARHDPSLAILPSKPQPPISNDFPPPRILAAFNRRHFKKFHRQFLASLRASGNTERVTAVAYGLYPSERSVLAHTPGVEVVPIPDNGVAPPIRRLLDFQQVLERWPENTPSAYWDAGDVLFQAPLSPLWEQVRANPSRLLAVREPRSHPENTAVANWTLSIHDPSARLHAFNLIAPRPFLNSGFAAGTARALLHYFREAHAALHSRTLYGSSDWGDQTALNLYCRTHPARFLETDQGWNYCAHDRPPRDLRLLPNGLLINAQGAPIPAVHGNAQSLRRLSISRRFT